MDFKDYLEQTNIKYEVNGDNLTVGGYLDLRGTNISSLPDNLTVGDSLDLSDTNISSLPDNLTVGGYLDLSGTKINKNERCKIKKLQNDFYIKHKNYIMSKLSWQNGKYRKIDGIFCEVIKQNKNILTVKIANTRAYIFSKNGIYAHGNTVKQAYFDWLFKTSDRDTSRYKNLKLNSKNSLEFWVIAYRTITGACSFGTNNYLENNKDKYKSEMTLEEVFKATKGQYGSSIFKAFFQNN